MNKQANGRIQGPQGREIDAERAEIDAYAWMFSHLDSKRLAAIQGQIETLEANVNAAKKAIQQHIQGTDN